MKSPMVSKCRNSAPTDTPARLVISAADARAYPTSTIASTPASSSAAIVSSRRCCCVLAMSGANARVRLRGADTRGQEPARLRRRAVALAELTAAVYDGAGHPGRHHRGVVAIDDAAQATV